MKNWPSVPSNLGYLEDSIVLFLGWRSMVAAPERGKPDNVVGDRSNWSNYRPRTPPRPCSRFLADAWAIAHTPGKNRERKNEGIKFVQMFANLALPAAKLRETPISDLSPKKRRRRARGCPRVTASAPCNQRSKAGRLTYVSIFAQRLVALILTLRRRVIVRIVGILFLGSFLGWRFTFEEFAQ
jgi:hypothetical protein